MRRFLRLSPFIPLFYWWTHYQVRLLCWLIARWRVTGRENVPAAGPLMVVSNHLHNADPVILNAAIPRRRIRFMAKVELFQGLSGLIVRIYGAFPVRRFESDLGALLAAERILKHGGVIGMFPEGTRSRTGYVGRPHPGTAMIALRSGATIVPCGIAGSEAITDVRKLIRRPRISVAIGEPITVAQVRRPTDEQVSALTERIFAAITALIPARNHDSYTGVPG